MFDPNAPHSELTGFDRADATNRAETAPGGETPPYRADNAAEAPAPVSPITAPIPQQTVPPIQPSVGNAPRPVYPQQPAYPPRPPVNSYTPYPQQMPQGAWPSYPAVHPFAAPPAHAAKNRKEKSKKGVGIGAVIACMAAAAVVGGGVGGGVMYAANAGFHSAATASAASSGSPVSINVSGSADVAQAVAMKVGPSVVGIRTTAPSVNSGPFGQQNSSAVDEGSGVVYSSDGYIITNYHVVQSAVEARNSPTAKVEVFLANSADTAINASVVGYDISSDLAVLKIDKTGLTAVAFGDSDKLKVGQTAVAIGNPGGLDFMGSVSMGIISGLNRTLQMENGTMTLLQTDAAINPGNSGGALADENGNLIGINNAKLSSDGDITFEGMGFSIPSNTVKTVVENILNNKNQPKAYIGIQIATQYDAATLQAYGYPGGVVIASVTSGGPADDAGLQAYDVIIKYGDTDVSSYTQFEGLMQKAKPGDKVTLTVMRGRQTGTVDVTLGESSGS